jgi:indole-3-glycerol phosphate synthase
MKKFFSLAVICCLAVTAVLFTSCENGQKSSYQYVVALDNRIEQDEKMCAQFELNEMPGLVAEMQKTSDQAGSIIYKDTKANADKRAKDAFASAIAKLREGGVGSYKDLVIVLKAMDNDTNKWSVIDEAKL